MTIAKKLVGESGKNYSVPRNGRNEKVRVAIVVRYRPDWASLTTIYQELLTHPQFDVTIVAVEDLWAYREFTTDYLSSMRIPHVPEDFYNVEVHDPHIIFCTTASTADSRPWVLRERSKLVYVPYASSVADDSYAHTYQYNQPLHKTAWRIYCQGDFHASQYLIYGGIADDIVKPLGHPKHESLYSDFSSAPEGDQFRFLWNIHFSPDGPFSAWNQYSDAVLHIPEESSNIHIIARPHPGFRDLAGPDNFEKLQSADRNYKSFELDLDPEMKPSFQHSNAMITDGSSLIFDYAFTHNPIIYLAKDEQNNLNQLAWNFLDACHYVANNQDELLALIKDLASGSDPKADARRRFMEEHSNDFVAPLGTASRIVADITDGIEELPKRSEIK